MYTLIVIYLYTDISIILDHTNSALSLFFGGLNKNLKSLEDGTKVQFKLTLRGIYTWSHVYFVFILDKF